MPTVTQAPKSSRSQRKRPPPPPTGEAFGLSLQIRAFIGATLVALLIFVLFDIQ